MIQGRKPEDVRRDAEKAKEFLKQKLMDFGLVWTAGSEGSV
jgi:hypothetical protein